MAVLPFTLRVVKLVSRQCNSCPHINAHQELIIFPALNTAGIFQGLRLPPIMYSYKFRTLWSRDTTNSTSQLTEWNDNYFFQGSNLIRIDLIENAINVSKKCVIGDWYESLSQSRQDYQLWFLKQETIEQKIKIKLIIWSDHSDCNPTLW